MDLEAGVYSWDNTANERQMQALHGRCGIKRVRAVNIKDHEPKVLNYILDKACADFVLIMHSGIEILQDDFALKMYQFMLDTPNVGLVSPNREGEPPQPHARPRQWWYDGIAGMFYRDGVRFDEDFIFSQWADVDIGLEYRHQGFSVWRDPRVSVRYSFRDFGERSAFYHAYSARNKLLLDTKWYRVGRGNWKGVAAYNESVSERQRIPTQFELAWHRQRELEVFAGSVESELHWILTDGGKENPNLAWENPVVLGRRAQ